MMTKEQLAHKLKGLKKHGYSGKLSGYAVCSIEESRSSYPVSNLIEYCKGTDIRMVMTDFATDEVYLIESIMDVHEVIGMLMERYNVDSNLIYRQTAVHYTSPKNGRTSLSVNTLLAVCSSLHCKVDFVESDESSVIIPDDYGNEERTT